jgi:prephenate dehydratase
MRKHQKVAYLGGPGSYSYVGCMMKFPEAVHMPFQTFATVFKSIQTGECDIGLVPIENVIAGRVDDVHHLLPGSGLYITGELYVSIEHCLLGLPGAILEEITQVHSHVQALSQCRAYISRNVFKTYTASDTASAARYVADEKNPQFSAIANKSAAKLHGLEVLKENIQDYENNVTRFVVLSRKQSMQTDCFACPVTTMTFDLGDNPGQLHRALSGFAQNNINIIRIESYLSRETFSSASFMIDFEGAPQDVSVKRTFSELSKFARKFNLLGTYESTKKTEIERRMSASLSRLGAHKPPTQTIEPAMLASTMI